MVSSKSGGPQSVDGPAGETQSVQVKISTRHGHLSEASQQNISAKAEKLLRIFDRITAIELTIDLVDSNSPRIDAKLSAEHKHDFVAHDQSDSLMASVDTVLHRLEQQLRKYKEKVQKIAIASPTFAARAGDRRRGERRLNRPKKNSDMKN